VFAPPRHGLAGGRVKESHDDWVTRMQREVLEMIGERQTWETPLLLAQAVDSSYVARSHLTFLADRLAQAVKDVEAGQSRYISVSMPPRLGKSFLTSVFFPLWVLHKHPEWDLMLLSHDPSLATLWGKQVRRGVENQGSMLNLALAKDAGAAKEFEVRPLDDEAAKTGSVLSRSIRESVTGRGAKVMILDDIVKDFAAAHSKTERDFVWDWWTANSRTRLHTPALVVAIGTRWHEDDFIGRLLSHEYDGDPAQWEVISFPALAEHPDAVDPRTKAPYGPDALGRKPGEPLLSPIVKESIEEALARWADIKQAVGSYAWAALFQQRPEPSEGAIFNNNWWEYWETREDLPHDEETGALMFDRVLTSWDCAFKGTDSSDYVVGQLWGAHGADRYLLKQVRKRMTFTETLTEMKSFIAGCAEWNNGVEVTEHIVEDKANGTAVIDTLKSEIPGMVPVNPTESKEARARAVSPIVEARNVKLPAEWAGLPDFLSEHKSFPNSMHDDQVDCTTQALRRMRGVSAVTAHVPQATIQRGYANMASPVATSRGSAVGGGTRRRT
jgi:predicted phage terminase large subunit-like protein